MLNKLVQIFYEVILPFGVMEVVVILILGTPFTRNSLHHNNLRLFVGGYVVCAGFLLLIYSRTQTFFSTVYSLFGGGLFFVLGVYLLFRARAAFATTPLLRTEGDPSWHAYLWFTIGCVLQVLLLGFVWRAWPVIRMLFTF